MVAYANIQTGKIVGAKKGTLVYYHEKGHIEFARSKKGMSLHFWQSALSDWTTNLIILSILLLIVSRLYCLIGVALACIFKGSCYVIDLYEERWCWRYAHVQLRESNLKS